MSHRDAWYRFQAISPKSFKSEKIIMFCMGDRVKVLYVLSCKLGSEGCLRGIPKKQDLVFSVNFQISKTLAKRRAWYVFYIPGSTSSSFIPKHVLCFDQS